MKTENFTACNKFKTKKKVLVGTLIYVNSTKCNISQKILALREKCPNTEFFWSVFSCIQSEYRKIQTRKNFVFGYFSRSEAKGRMLIGSSIYTKKDRFQE